MMAVSFRLLLLSCCMSFVAGLGTVKSDWDAIAQAELSDALNTKPNLNVAKNVILFVGDGMGISTLTASRIYKGQLAGRPGEETVLAWEKFPSIGLSKVYQADRQVPGSAGTGTCMFSGKKTVDRTVGVNHNVIYGDCSTEKGNEVTTLANWAADAGKSVGVISTARLTHATPAAMYAHSVSRLWENDGKLPEDAKGVCEDIAAQLIKQHHIQVFLGGGRAQFLPNTTTDVEYENKMGLRKDGRNLIEEWKNSMKAKDKKYEYVWNKTQLDMVSPDKTDYLLGMFEPSHMHYEANRENDKAGEPSLAEMTEKAISILKKNEKGFFLLVEGARIDHGHHDSLARQALSETLGLEKAVKSAKKLTDDDDTLIVVTADHSHVFTIGGYPTRGNDILGLVDNKGFQVEPSRDGLPYLTLGYVNGPNAPINAPRKSLTGLTKEELHDFEFMQPAAIPTKYETHGGEDVAIYATGPMSHLFHRTHEQHFIAHALAYAACIGQNKGHCYGATPGGQSGHRTCGGNRHEVSDLVFFVTLFCLSLSRLLVY